MRNKEKQKRQLKKKINRRKIALNRQQNVRQRQVAQLKEAINQKRMDNTLLME